VDSVEETLVYSDADISSIICGMWRWDTWPAALKRKDLQNNELRLPHSSSQIAVSMVFRHLAAYAATPPNQPQQCILTDYFNNFNFRKIK